MPCNPCVTNNQSYLYIPPVTAMNIRKPLYSNNALVFYKPSSLPSCPIGSVRNSSIASKRI